jgi:hypothetical protein
VWVKNKRLRVVVVLEMRVLRRKWEMTDCQNGSLIDSCTAASNHDGICTVQLGIVVYDGTNTNQNAVMHCPHPVLSLRIKGVFQTIGGNYSPMSHSHTFFAAKNKLLSANTSNFRIDRLRKCEGNVRTRGVRRHEIWERFFSRMYIGR